jgi:hypothetical protein
MTQQDETVMLMRAALVVGCLVASMFLALIFFLKGLT